MKVYDNNNYYYSYNSNNNNTNNKYHNDNNSKKYQFNLIICLILKWSKLMLFEYYNFRLFLKWFLMMDSIRISNKN